MKINGHVPEVQAFKPWLITRLLNVNKLKIYLLHRVLCLFNLAITRFKNQWPFNLIKIRE
jgi:hypothetical protein